MYTDPTVGSVVWALRNRKWNCACVVIVCEVTARASSCKMKSDNVFCVGSSFPHFRRAFTSFEDNTHSQFYTRDARTLTAAARLTPKIAEKANTDLTTSSDTRVSMAVQPTSVAGGARVSGEAQPVCGIACGKGDPLSTSERLSRVQQKPPPCPEEAPSSSQPYPLRGSEHKQWADTLNITPFFLKCVILRFFF